MMTSQPNGRATPRLTGALDVGSFKTICLIATTDRHGRPERIVSVGHVPSRGIKSGVIVDLAGAEYSIRTAIADAERMAGVRLAEVDVAVNCGRLGSRSFQASALVNGGVIDADTRARLADAARDYAERDGRRLVHLSELALRADGVPIAESSDGLAAERLSADFHAVTADAPALNNLGHTIGRCYLGCGALVPGPMASGLAVTSPEERRAGTVVIDIGAGVTGISAFLDGRYIYSECIAMGGGHITLDIAHALRMPLEEAERIKTLYGTVHIAQSDQHDVVTYAGLGGSDEIEQRTTKADLARIIQARMAALLQLVRERLADAGLTHVSAGQMVICGGSSELPGLIPFAEGFFRRPLREGRPRQISGLPPLVASAAFAGVVGVLEARAASAAHILPSTRATSRPQGYFGKVGQWLKDGF